MGIGIIPLQTTPYLELSTYTTAITPAQVNASGGYEITSPGYYYLTDNLNFYPNGYTNDDPITHKCCIYINADNVILDWCD